MAAPWRMTTTEGLQAARKAGWSLTCGVLPVVWLRATRAGAGAAAGCSERPGAKVDMNWRLSDVAAAGAWPASTMEQHCRPRDGPAMLDKRNYVKAALRAAVFCAGHVRKAPQPQRVARSIGWMEQGSTSAKAAAKKKSACLPSVST